MGIRTRLARSSSWLSVALIAVGAFMAFGGCKKDKPANSEIEGPLTRAGDPARDVSATPAGNGGATRLGGPFDSIETYCKGLLAKLDKDACNYGHEASSCSCLVATKDAVDGPLSASASGGALREAKLLLVTTSASDEQQCEIALHLADGWHVYAKAFPCGPALAAHDADLKVKVDSFQASRQGGKDSVDITWTASESTWDVDDDAPGGARDVPLTPKKFALQCEVGGPDKLATCTPKRALP